METGIFLKGMFLGFALCAPLGPIGVVCMRRALLEGRLSGLLSVLGASTMDALYCVLAGFGIAWIADIIRQEMTLFQLVGGMILLFLGIKVFLSRKTEYRTSHNRKGLAGSFATTFLIMLTNPLPILIFTAAIAALGIRGWQEDGPAMAAMTGGVFAGSVAWGPILVTAVHPFQRLFRDPESRILNWLSGALISGFGMVFALMAVFKA